VSAPADAPADYLAWQASTREALVRCFDERTARVFDDDVPPDVPWLLRWQLQEAFLRAVLAGIHAVETGALDDAVANAQAVFAEHIPSSAEVMP